MNKQESDFIKGLTKADAIQVQKNALADLERQGLDIKCHAQKIKQTEGYKAFKSAQSLMHQHILSGGTLTITQLQFFTCQFWNEGRVTSYENFIW